MRDTQRERYKERETNKKTNISCVFDTKVDTGRERERIIRR